MNEVRWRKSTYSGNAQGECVEVAVGQSVGVRDTKDRAGGELAVESLAWRVFTSQLGR